MAILVSQSNGTAAMLVFQSNPVGVESSIRGYVDEQK